MKYLLIAITLIFSLNATATESDLRKVLNCKAATNLLLGAYKQTNNKNMILLTNQFKQDILNTELALSKKFSYQQIKKFKSKSKTELSYMESINAKEHITSSIIKAMKPNVQECQEYINKLEIKD